MARIQIYVSADMKRRASQLFEDLGLDPDTAINMFLSQSLCEVELPFRSRLSKFDRDRRS
ncbi:type II toxin-antitoxin system RelB/DinJ family antitoxin [Bifidobacterium sp. ESL0819]|uniref:type II toxin-antitoxin system RelB/DinJ family antitoxin n=1 Tax=Bifidobacterium sp. ESL0819 TaxID=3448589 RepID=UPI00404135F7